MAHMISMPPSGLISPALFLDSKYIFLDYMVLGDDLQISFTDNGTFWGTPQNFFVNSDLPPFPLGMPIAAPYTFTGTSKQTGVVALTFYDAKTKKTYVCILTIVGKQ